MAVHVVRAARVYEGADDRGMLLLPTLLLLLLLLFSSVAMTSVLSPVRRVYSFYPARNSLMQPFALMKLCYIQ